MAKTTVSEVARDAGVSRATADRVLNRRGGVSLDKERRVMLSARKLGLDRDLGRGHAKALRVSVLMKPPPNPFYARLLDGFREANLLYQSQGVTAYVHYIDVREPDLIRAKIERLGETYDALVIVAPVAPPILELLRRVGEKIPVVTLATDLPLGDGHHYVGPDNVRSGRLAGEVMGRLLGPAGGRILLVAGFLEFSGHLERKNGFRAILEESFPRCTIAAEIENYDQSSIAAEEVALALKHFGDIDGIYNISQGNDEIADRIARQVRSHPVTFVCHDLTEITRKLILERRIDAIIDQDPVLEARRAIELVLQHYGRWTGAKVDGRTPLAVLLRESVAADAD